ncbi:MAG: two pore domain potassium channel family protein, partial [Nitrospira sp.]|nr:two pore domain potassium channel family protein [Nitrospira sp.]
IQTTTVGCYLGHLIGADRAYHRNFDFCSGVLWINLCQRVWDVRGCVGSGFEVCVYYSFVTHTTLGFGDLIPTGPLRFLTGIESLTGLVLITWTASCIYLQMETLHRKNFKSG